MGNAIGHSIQRHQLHGADTRRATATDADPFEVPTGARDAASTTALVCGWGGWPASTDATASDAYAEGPTPSASASNHAAACDPSPGGGACKGRLADASVSAHNAV